MLAFYIFSKVLMPIVAIVGAKIGSCSEISTREYTGSRHGQRCHAMKPTVITIDLSDIVAPLVLIARLRSSDSSSLMEVSLCY